MIDFDPTTALAIASSTDATPIVIDTATAHGLTGSGHQVAILGHLTNTNANGGWTVGVVDATHLTLIGSTATGGGAGGATGFVIPYTAGGVGIAEDGEDANASAGGSGATITSMVASSLDRIAFVRALTVLKITDYTTAGPTNDAVPDAALCTVLIGWGAGGSGGGGGGGVSSSTTSKSSGGGGGGQAKRSVQILFLKPRTVSAVAVGQSPGGGNGGPDSTTGNAGADGGDTTYGALATFAGGGYGVGGFLSSAQVLALGGGISGPLPNPGSVSVAPNLVSEGIGGYGAQGTGLAVGAGHRSAEGFAGGVGGSIGTTDGSHPTGGPGGGGGGGPGGPGGAGGNGLNLSAGFATVTTVQSSSNAAVNSGAGGGGGAGGGNSNISTRNGAAGGSGGSGRLIVIHLGAPPQ